MNNIVLPNRFVTTQYQFTFTNPKELGGQIVRLFNEKESILHAGIVVEAQSNRLCVTGYDPVNNKAKMLTFFPQDFVGTKDTRPKWTLDILAVTRV